MAKARKKQVPSPAPPPDDDAPEPPDAREAVEARQEAAENRLPAVREDEAGDLDDVPDPAHDLEQRKVEAGVDQRFPFGRPGEPIGTSHPFKFGFIAALGVITAWMLVQAAQNAKSVIVMIVVALFLAVGLNPAVERLKKVGMPRTLAVATVFLGVILFFAGFVASLVQPVSEQTDQLRKNIPHYVQQLQDNKTLAKWDKRYHLLEKAEKAVNSNGFQQGLTDTATGIGKVALNGVFQTITILILTLYFLSSLPQIKTFFYQLAPRSRRARVALLGDEILDRIGGYVAGQFTIAFIAGVSTYIFLSVLDVKYATALALIVAVTDLIPLIGATIGAVIVCLVAFLTGGDHSITHGIACIIFYVIYQQVENYVVYPRVMKRTVDVQPAVTIVAALVGAALLGVVGALLAIPTAAAISLLIREVVMPRQENM
ncbi:AI-2E family transporter [Actinomadura barringtoniae]|uniref:AI-2E family transporter n=1 Tax=Actinomadura barringtoniae TaxID=1427535 RepID=UPI003557BDCB